MPAWAMIARKDLRLLWRDRPALFWVLVFPLVFALFFGSVMRADEGQTQPMKVILVSPSSPLDPSTAPAQNPPSPALSDAEQRLVNFLETAGLRLLRQPEAAARDAVRRGEALAFIRLPQAPGESILLAMDPSRHSEAALLKSLLAAAGANVLQPVNTEPVLRGGVGAQNGFEIVFPAMILWGLLGCAAAFAVSLVAERSNGSLIRLRAAPITRTSILGGKAAACACASLADALLLTAIGWLVLGVRVAAPQKFIAAVAAMVICFTGLTVVLSVLGSSEQGVAGAGWATLILMAMLGGAMVPLHLLPKWLLAASNLSPVKWGILALEGATWRDFHWRELARPLAILVSVGIASFAAGVGILISQREV